MLGAGLALTLVLAAAAPGQASGPFRHRLLSPEVPAGSVTGWVQRLRPEVLRRDGPLCEAPRPSGIGQCLAPQPDAAGKVAPPPVSAPPRPDQNSSL